MADGVWISIIGLGALGLVLLLIVRDARNAPRGVGLASAEPVAGQPAVAAASGTPATNPMAALPGNAWKLWGWVLMAGGLVGLVVSLMLGTTVETFAPPSAYSVGSSSDVVNFDLMFRKGVAVACSLFALALGVFTLAIGAIIRAIVFREG